MQLTTRKPPSYGTEAWSEEAGHRSLHASHRFHRLSGRPLSPKLTVCPGEASCAGRSTPTAWSTEVLPVVAQAGGLSV